MKTVKPKRTYLFILAILSWPFFFLSNLYATAYIEIDSAIYNAGSIREDKVKKIEHSFRIRNIGNSDLIIEKVKPG